MGTGREDILERLVRVRKKRVTERGSDCDKTGALPRT